MTTERFIHLSDLHIRDRGQEFQRAVRVFDAIGKSYPKVPVLITGDIVDSGKTDQMDCAKVLIARLAATNPTLVVPGNHDYAWKGLVCDDDAWKGWVARLGAPLGWDRPAKPWLTGDFSGGVDGLGVWEDGEAVFFGVDSGDPTDQVKTAKGFISAKLADGLKAALADARHRGKCRVVMLHHHPFDDGAFMKLEGAELFLAAVRGSCEAVLFGHDHHLGVWRRRDDVPIMVASHKTTDALVEHHLMINVIEASRTAAGAWSFWHRLELV